jgi:6-phosphogluconolactonase (cycloisomerase 2 family)
MGDPRLSRATPQNGKYWKSTSEVIMRPSRVSACTLFAASAITSIASAQSVAPAVFVTNNVGDSVSSFTVNPNGSLSFVGAFPSGDGPQTVSLSPDGRWLAVANGTASTTVEELRIFEVNPNATLTQRLLTTVNDSPLDVQWLDKSTLAVAQTSLTAGNLVRTFNWNSAGPTFSLIDTESTGNFTSRLATARGGSLLYANNTSGGSGVNAFSVAPGGNMTFMEFEAATLPVNLAASNSGNLLYTAGGIGGDGHRINGFFIDPGGTLTPTAAGSYTSPGTSPKVVALTGDDALLIAGHGTDATAQVFSVNPVTGDLTFTGNAFDVGDQGNLGDLQTLGNLLFITHSASDGTGPAGIYSFTVGPTGVLTQNGPILGTGGARPEYIATWVGVPEPSSSAVACAMSMGLLARASRRRRC